MYERFYNLRERPFALSPDPDLAVAALMIARIEYPKLDARPYLEQLDSLGREAAVRVARAKPRCRVAVLAPDGAVRLSRDYDSPAPGVETP